MTEPEKLDLRSQHLANEKPQKLLRLFPDLRATDGQLSFACLKLALGEAVDAGTEKPRQFFSRCYRALAHDWLGRIRSGFRQRSRRSRLSAARWQHKLAHRDVTCLQALERRVLLVMDFGDAPSSAPSGFTGSYATTLEADGARHSTIGLQLGANRDDDPNGQPTANAKGDDFRGGFLDEDGVSFLSILEPGRPARLRVDVADAAGTNRLDAGTDWNCDGVTRLAPASVSSPTAK